jgi:hypothetical protein
MPSFMRNMKRKQPVHRLTKEVTFFSICTNDSIPDTLVIDRTYETVAGISSAAMPSRVFASGERGPEPPFGSVPAARHDGWRAYLYDAPLLPGRERIELA